MSDDPKPRANHLSVVEHFSLDDACRAVNAAFMHRGFGVYQVGSSLQRANYRDVDLRLILQDDDFKAIFGGEARFPLALQFLNVAISEWIAKRTGMNIDFQFQSQTEANTNHPGLRSAIGRALRYDGGEW